MNQDNSSSKLSSVQAQTETLAHTDGNSLAERQQVAQQLRQQLSITGWAALVVLLTCPLFLYWNYQPVYHTDIWGHVSYGEWILQHRSLPQEDPFVDLAAGVEVIDNAWLSQILFAKVVGLAGPSGLNDLYAVTCLAILLTFIKSFSTRSGSVLLGFLFGIGAWAMFAGRLSILRPELYGTLCFALLLMQIAMIDRQRNSGNKTSSVPKWAWLTIPVTFIFWANLHGSYIVGFLFLGAMVAGTAFETLHRRGSLQGTLSDKTMRSDLLMLQFALLATCVNPYGIDLLLQTVLFPSHPNLKSVMEWYSLEMKSLEGIPMLISWIAAAFAIRHSRRQFAVRDVLILLALCLAVCMRVRMIAWYAPVYFFVMAPHFTDCINQLMSLRPMTRLTHGLNFMQRPSFHVAILTGFACYLTFAFAPISRHSMGGKDRPLDQVVSHQTPLGVTEYFEQNPPQGMIYAPQWWGDWITWKSKHNVEVFASTNAIHLTPENVWNDYLAISRARSSSPRLLNRYRINTMVVSKALQPALVNVMDEKSDWRAVHRDDVSVIYERNATSAVASAEEKPAIH